MTETMTAKQALQDWAAKTRVTPTEFARKMGYTYNHAYQLLRGNVEVTLETLGRFVVAYGAKAAQPIAATFSDQTDMDGALVLPEARLTARPTHKPTKTRKTGKQLSPASIPGVQIGFKTEAA